MKHAKHKTSSHMPLHWNRLLLMAALHFALMYALMYAMVDQLQNVLPNLNQAYMAAIMTAPMLLLEGWLMGSMYADKRPLATIMGISVLVFVGAFAAVRGQVAIGDRAFLRSMIPHHGGAILMCEQASIEDTQIRDLCERILTSQQAEIEEMNSILERID